MATWLTTLVVRLDDESWSRAVAFVPDMVPAEDWRQLRIVLRVIGSTRQRLAHARRLR